MKPTRPRIEAGSHRVLYLSGRRRAGSLAIFGWTCVAHAQPQRGIQCQCEAMLLRLKTARAIPHCFGIVDSGAD